MIEIKFTGVEETRRFLAQAPKKLREAVKKSMKQAAVLTKNEAIFICPVDTGYLRSSIFYNVDSDWRGFRYSFTVGAKADYAGYVEWGTSKMMAQPYIRPAFIFVTNFIPSAMGKMIDDEIGKM